ncbi:MAG: hypothetical protein CVT49_01815 [candidate division Zixibacteria bacterium HGW-Zixibacteria-1]|nr:MAG: hypothetical protein CVT49_01815 [candidate division Zixibacteria bacterium HGW-Zixibacteria-1]
MSKISAVIITKNEEANIERCLKSVDWVDEIIVVDTDSTDKTRRIATEAGARVFQVEWQGFGHAKGFGVEKASHDWILSIDADEEIGERLASEIKGVIASDRAENGFEIPRRTSFLGRWIKYSRWYPDYVLRLFKKNSGRFNDSLVHEKVMIEGSIGRLANPILHYSYPDIDTYFIKFEKYTSLAAQELYNKGKRFHLAALIFKPIASFFRHYVTGLGFLDGVEGFLIAVLSAFGVVTRYVKLRSLEKASRHD